MVFNKCALLNTFSVVRSRAFLFALLATLSLVISSLSPLVARAESIYDNTYLSTDHLDVNHPSKCSDNFDITTDWSKYVLDENFYYSGSNVNFSTISTSFSNALENGRWGVSTGVDGNGASTVRVYWTEDTSLALSWYNYTAFGQLFTGIENNATYNVEIMCNSDYGKNTPQGFGYTGASGVSWPVVPTWRPNALYNFFVYTDYPNYPEGYQGADIPQQPVGQDVAVRPDFKYNIVDKNLKVKDYGQELPTITPDEGYTFKGWDVEWSLFYCEGGWQETGSSCSTELQQVAYDILPVETDFVTDVDVYGDYRLFAEYQAQQCYRYPSYPATPDYCFYVGGESETSLEGYYFPPTSVKLKFDGGTYSGDTKETECDEAGYCVPPSPYEDCSPYGGIAPYGFGGGAFPDLIGGFACQLRNFGTFLIITFQSLFIPNSGKVQKTMDGFTTFFQGKLGFVYTAFSFIIEWLGSILIITPSCNLNAFNGTFFGATPSVNVCQMEQTVPTIWNIGITFTRLLFGAALVFIAYRRMLNILTGLGK